jgi:hypothetical protein
MKQRKISSPAEMELPFEYDSEHADERITAHGGVPVLVQAFRSLDLGRSANRHLRIKQRERGMDEATYLESFVILNGVGGDCPEDFDHLRQDCGLRELIGHDLPSSSAALKFLYRFHDETKVEQAQMRLAAGQLSYIPADGEALEGLSQVNTDLVKEFGRRCADQRIATIDLDSTIIESWKKQAKGTYEGTRGYQPMLALWSELNVIVADEFRDGNVPAQQQPLPVAKRAFQALPDTVNEYYFRGDSACYEKELLSWLRDEQREGGPAGPIWFAVSMRMNATIKSKIKALPEEAWKPYGEDREVVRECADLTTYWPEWDEEKPYGPLRYVAIRIRQRQGEMFADGEQTKHFAVVTNQWEWTAKQLLQWHREKAGSIEAAHDVLKNELAAGVMPCSRFGANAAWLRMAVITFNVLGALKRLALPAELLTARPKRLRFLLFQTAGRIVHHARRVVCRVVQNRLRIGSWPKILAALPIPA